MKRWQSISLAVIHNLGWAAIGAVVALTAHDYVESKNAPDCPSEDSCMPVWGGEDDGWVIVEYPDMRG